MFLVNIVWIPRAFNLLANSLAVGASTLEKIYEPANLVTFVDCLFVQYLPFLKSPKIIG